LENNSQQMYQCVWQILNQISRVVLMNFCNPRIPFTASCHHVRSSTDRCMLQLVDFYWEQRFKKF